MLREVYKKLEDGEHLGDVELAQLSSHLGVAFHILSDLGPTYQLAYQELLRRKQQVDGYIEERKKKRESHEHQ